MNILPWKVREVLDHFRPRSIKQGIKNLIIWFPIIWNDRNWDYYYIWLMMRKKLDLTEKCIRNGHHVNREKDAKKIKIAINILDRLIEDKYEDMVFKNHENEYGKIIMKSAPDPNNPDLYIVDIYREYAFGKEDREIERKKSKQLYIQATKLKNNDIKYLFNHMAKYIQHWWD